MEKNKSCARNKKKKQIHSMKSSFEMGFHLDLTTAKLAEEDGKKIKVSRRLN